MEVEVIGTYQTGRIGTTALIRRLERTSEPFVVAIDYDKEARAWSGGIYFKEYPDALQEWIRWIRRTEERNDRF